MAKLKDAVKGAALARLDAAVAAGRISQSDADELRSAIEAGAVPLLGGFGGVAGVGHVRIGPFGGPLDAAAKAIGIDVSTLRSELENGKTLAQVAGEHGVSTDALVQALLADAKSHLDAAVKAGRMTSDQESQALSDLKSHLDELVNGSHVGLMIPKA